MRTIIIKVPVTMTEYNLLVAAKSDQPHPERMRALLVAEARSTLRRMIDMVDQERNATFSGKPVPSKAEVEPKPVREHLRRPSRATLGKPKTPLLDSLTKHGLPRRDSGSAGGRVRVINEGYYGLDLDGRDRKALDREHARIRKDNGRQRASVNRNYQAGKCTSEQRDQALADIDRREKLVLKRADPRLGTSKARPATGNKTNHSDHSAQPEWLSDDNIDKLRS